MMKSTEDLAQGLGHLDERLIWTLAIPSAVGGAIVLAIIVILVQDEIWYRRLVRRASRLAASASI